MGKEKGPRSTREWLWSKAAQRIVKCVYERSDDFDLLWLNEPLPESVYLRESWTKEGKGQLVEPMSGLYYKMLAHYTPITRDRQYL